MARFNLRADDILVIDDMKLACMMAAPLDVKVCYAGWSGIGIQSIYDEMKQLCHLTFNTTDALYNYLFER